MSVDDRGTHQPEGDERAEREARKSYAGRHRRGRVAVTAVEPALEEAEPLFTSESDLELLFGSPEPAVLRPMVEDLLDLSGGPLEAPPLEAPPLEAPPLDAPPLVQPATAAEPRPGLFGSFRRWWRDESMARAAQKRAFATAEAIIRAQAVQDATNPLEKAPTPESYAQAVRGVMSLTEERFQSLGLRSDRLQDELRAISRTMNELRGLLFLGGFEGVGPAAASAIGTLQQRFDALLVGLSEEFARRAQESDRRLADQITMQSAELAALLESAVERIRAVIPQEIDRVIPQEMAKVRAAIPQEFQRVADTIPGQLERIREDHRQELDRLREAIPGGFATVRAMIPEELAKIVPDQVDRVREANAEDFERIRAQIPDELEKVRLTIPVEIERLRATIPEALERVRGDVAELSVVLHEVIAQIVGITSAASGQGERAEPR